MRKKAKEVMASLGQDVDPTKAAGTFGMGVQQMKKQLLSTSSDSVELIAERCGFNSVSHFSRAFRKRVGMTPSQFRSIW